LLVQPSFLVAIKNEKNYINFGIPKNPDDRIYFRLYQFRHIWILGPKDSSESLDPEIQRISWHPEIAHFWCNIIYVIF